jgi:hypothetical protein
MVVLEEMICGTAAIQACIPHQSHHMFAELRVVQHFAQFLKRIVQIRDDHGGDQEW